MSHNHRNYLQLINPQLCWSKRRITVSYCRQSKRITVSYCGQSKRPHIPTPGIKTKHILVIFLCSFFLEKPKFQNCH